MTDITPVGSSSTPPSIEDVLLERGGRYGDFRNNAEVAQAIKDTMRAACNWDLCPSYVREGLDLIALKISRVVTGNPMYGDNWVDIEGYARIVNERITRDHDIGMLAVAEWIAENKSPVLPDPPHVPDILGALARSPGLTAGKAMSNDGTTVDGED